MSRNITEFYNAYIDSLSPEQVEANGGRAACMEIMKQHNKKRRLKILWNNIKCILNGFWFLVKGLILVLAVLYFINALLF